MCSQHYVCQGYTFNRYVQFSLWSRGNATDCGARGPGVIYGKEFYGFLFVVFYIFSKTHYLSRNFAIIFALLIH